MPHDVAGRLSAGKAQWQFRLLAWRVEETEGAIGFATQQELLAVVADWLPADPVVVLLADRFYGTPEIMSHAAYWFIGHRQVDRERAWWSRVGQVNWRDDDVSRSDLRRPSLPRRDY
jgi:hypothetical protein